MSAVEPGADAHISDPHVARIYYRLRPNERTTYRSPSPVECETTDAHFRLAEGDLVCEMRTHCDDISDALALIEPVLRSWEANADLTLSREEVRFDFVTADVVDRAPLLAGSGRMRVLAAQTGHFAVGGMNVTLCAERARYPEPPYRFRLTPDAKSLLDRYNGYLDGREPLPAMAYFCLTMLEAIAGSRPGAAKHFGIDSKVLSKVGEVTANRGDLLTARKGRAIQPLTSKERAWLEAAVRAFIYRVGDTRPISTLPTLTMADLPKLQ